MAKKTLPRCDSKVFKSGTTILTADTHECGATGFEEWVVAVRKASGQPVDWHYSGGIANMLFLGDKEKVVAAIQSIPCSANIRQEYFDRLPPPIYREGVSPVPRGTIAVDTLTNTFMVDPEQV